MIQNFRLEIEPQFYEHTKQVIIENGSKMWEQTFGGRKNLFSDGELCGTIGPGDYLPLKNITRLQFAGFLGAFTRNLYAQIKKNDLLLTLNIEFEGVSRDKNYNSWKKMKNRTVFYNVDLISAYWQIAYRLGYISKKMFDSYLLRDEFKEAKRYCVSFLARENEMHYFDGREIDKIICNNDCLIQVYENIRNELYTCLYNIRKELPDWVEYNIDGLTIMKKDLQKVKQAFNEMQLIYKVNEYIKVDSNEYVNHKGKFRKF
jgi:hypothetical protein